MLIISHFSIATENLPISVLITRATNYCGGRNSRVLESESDSIESLSRRHFFRFVSRCRFKNYFTRHHSGSRAAVTSNYAGRVKIPRDLTNIAYLSRVANATRDSLTHSLISPRDGREKTRGRKRTEF